MYPCIYPSCTGLSPPTVAFSKYVPLSYIQLLGSTVFARHYSRYNYCSLFLRLLRCFSSPGFLPLRDYRSSTCRVAPFGHLWIYARLQLPIAFRSLPRPSSSLRAKASTIRPYLLPILKNYSPSGIRIPNYFYSRVSTLFFFSKLVNELFSYSYDFSTSIPIKVLPS